MALTVLGGGVSPFVRKVRVFLAEKGVYLPWPDLDIDAVIGEEVAIALGQADRLKQRRFARMQVRRRI